MTAHPSETSRDEPEAEEPLSLARDLRTLDAVGMVKSEVHIARSTSTYEVRAWFDETTSANVAVGILDRVEKAGYEADLDTVDTTESVVVRGEVRVEHDGDDEEAA